MERCCILFFLLSFRRVFCIELANDVVFAKSPFVSFKVDSSVDEVLKYQ